MFLDLLLAIMETRLTECREETQRQAKKRNERELIKLNKELKTKHLDHWTRHLGKILNIRGLRKRKSITTPETNHKSTIFKVQGRNPEILTVTSKTGYSVALCNG